MKCNEALALMMEADLAELEVTGVGALAAHISGCGRCSTVASALRADTRELASAFAGPNSVASATAFQRRRTRFAAVVSPATALAASALLWIMLKVAFEPPSAPVAVPLALPPSVAANRVVVRAEPATPPAVVAPRTQRIVVPVPVRPVAVQATAVVPVTADAVSDNPDLQVDPPPGTRATVMHGSNNVTVVWLTK